MKHWSDNFNEGLFGNNRFCGVGEGKREVEEERQKESLVWKGKYRKSLALCVV